jgi:hypothetical protein
MISLSRDVNADMGCIRCARNEYCVSNPLFFLQ